MAIEQAGVIELIGGIYDCALKPDNWPEVFVRIADEVDGISAALSIHDPIANKARFSSTWNVPDGAIERYNQVYAAINPVMTSGWFCAVDEPISAAEYAGPEEYFSSRFCREFLTPLGWGDAIGTHLMKTVNRYSIFAIFVPLGKGVIGRQELDFVRVLSPHIRRAVTISDLLDAREIQNGMLSSTLDLLAVGIVLTDERARIVHANLASEKLLDSRSALRRDGGCISARDAESAQELSVAIAVAAAGRSAEMPATGIAVPLRNSDGPDLAAWVLPLDGGLRKAWGSPVSAKVAVFIREIGDSRPFQGEMFVKRYRITPAECQVLMLLLQGLSPMQISETLDRRETTIKSHLSHMFAKTGTSTQADLVRLALSVVAPASLDTS
jgi:DNA-binding CsgD family transcriptional regulator